MSSDSQNLAGVVWRWCALAFAVAWMGIAMGSEGDQRTFSRTNSVVWLAAWAVMVHRDTGREGQ